MKKINSGENLTSRLASFKKFGKLAAGLIITLICLGLWTGSQTPIKIGEIPNFQVSSSVDPTIAEAERLVFVSHYLNRMVGSVPKALSEFERIPDAWYESLKKDSASMNQINI